MGNSRKRVREFPKEVKADIGAALYDVQKGVTPPRAKPFRGVGHGVFEMVTRFDTNTYRTVYAVQIGERIYVLHAFQKKSPKGRKTANLDVEMIVRRYKEAVELERRRSNGQKNKNRV